MAISPAAIERAMSAAMQALAQLTDDDEQLRTDTIEGQSDVYEVMDKLAGMAIADELLVERGRERLKRLEARSARIRATLGAMLEALDQRKAERALYTASLDYHRKPVVTGTLPAEYMREAPDLRKLSAALHAGKQIEGAELGNAEPRLTIRTR